MPLARSRSTNSSPIDVGSLAFLPSDIVDTDELIIIRNGQTYKNTAENVKLYVTNGTQVNNPVTDPYVNNVVLFVKPTLINGNWVIADNSLNPKAVQLFGDTSVSTLINIANGRSIRFDGNGDYLLVNHHIDFRLSNNDYTIEIVINPIEWKSEDPIITKYNAAPTSNTNQFYLGQFSNNINFGISIDGSNYIQLLECPIPLLSQKHHIAVSRIDDFTGLFVNGILRDTYTGNYTLFNNETDPIGIGYRRNNGVQAQNNIDTFWSHARITNGIGRYSTDFDINSDTYLFA